MPESSLRQQYERIGFVIIPNLIPDENLQPLLDASHRVIRKTRAGAWRHRRTVGSQFPPYKDSDDSWGVQHVMHPDLGESAFLSWYCSDQVRGLAKELMACQDEDLQMELFNILINPQYHEFALRWHRDDVKGTATDEEEKAGLAVRHYGVQWNTALYDDECLFVVPGSHAAPRTPEQRAHSSGAQAPTNPLDMPKSIQVKLKAGETVVYNQNILHCATYDPHHERATLHACIGNTIGGNSRARNILQHGVKWMKQDDFKDVVSKCGPEAQHMWQNTMRMSSTGETVAYSQD